MLKIQYRDAKDGGIEVLRCFSKEDQVEIPSEIEGKRVTKIGDYAFSAHKRKEDEAKEIMIGEDFLGSEDEPMFCGEAVKEVYLPPDTVEIGKYAFYGCINLTTLGFSDSLLRTGTGIFTGCKLQKIYYDVYEDKKSALRDVVRDTRFPLQVNIRYKKEEKQSRLFYPEYYEEAVENTPARIVETHFHGTGYQYRQSFLRGEIDYRKYDDIFPVAAVQEDLDIVWEILAGRMLMPYGVSDFAWMQYEGYVKQNQCEMMNYLKEEDQMPFINLMAEKNYFSKEGIEAAIDWASRKQKTELLSILMNEQHKRFPKKKKTFEL